MIRIATWYNLTAKTHEAVVVGRGRPVRQDVALAEREKSSREFFNGATAEAAAAKLTKTLGLKKDEVEVIKASETGVVYKGKREMPYVRKTETTPAA